jgi:hypothetical protein
MLYLSERFRLRYSAKDVIIGKTANDHIAFARRIRAYAHYEEANQEKEPRSD